MSDQFLFTLTPPTLPPGFCPTSWQDLINKGIGQTTVVFNSTTENSFYNFGDSVPAADKRGFPWLRTIGGQIDRWYLFSNGYWLSRYDPAGSAHLRWLFEGTSVDLETFDGGEAGAVDTYHGPFWEIDHNYDGRIGMGPGVIQNAQPSKTLSLSETYGEGGVIAGANSMPPHTHPLTSEASIMNADGTIKTVTTGAGSSGLMIGLTAPPATPLAVAENTVSGGGAQERIPTIPPVRGLYYIKRTIRLFYRVNP